MKKQTTIAGLTISLNFCKKINVSPICVEEVSKGSPLANIYKDEKCSCSKTSSYTVNILIHVPVDIESMDSLDLTSGLFIKDKLLYLSYNGVNDIKTSINNDDNGKVVCRVFGVDYYYDSKTKGAATDFDLYHVQFNYSFKNSNTQAVEAILVQGVNEDPETDRGTVTTPRDDDE